MARAKVGSKKEVRPDVWVVRASSGYTKQGKQRRASKTVYGTEEQADIELVRLNALMGKSVNVGDELSMSEYVYGVFLPNRKDLTNATLTSYKSVYANHIEPTFGKTGLSSITRPMVQTWLSQQAPNSAKNRMRVMSAILNGAVEDGFMDTPVVLTHMRYPRRDYVDPTADSWDVDEVRACLELLEGNEIFPLWLVMVGAGLSRSEACALEWSDVSEIDGWTVVSVTKARTERDGFKEPKNRFRRRVVPVAEPFGSKLREHEGEGLLWPWTPANATVHWKRLFTEGRELESIPFAHLGRMRATHETLLQKVGVLDSLNARIHGRSNVQTGYTHYQATRLDPMLAAADMLYGLLESS